MASNTCLRRVSGRLQALQSTSLALHPSLRPSHSSPFSTTSALLNVQKKKSASQTGPPKRGEKSLRLQKSGNRKTDYKRPAVGERKALRNRIVLSNTNALEVSDLEDLDATNLKDTQIQGKVLGIPGPVVDSLRAVDAFKPRQGWYYFRRPATLMRKETMELFKLLNEVDANSTKRTVRRIISGERLGGQSTLLLQGLSAAFLKGWVVINLPDGRFTSKPHARYSF
jgi:small subunit ribosomal protein S29